MKFDEIDQQYFAGLGFAVVISILIGGAFGGLLLLASWIGQAVMK